MKLQCKKCGSTNVMVRLWCNPLTRRTEWDLYNSDKKDDLQYLVNDTDGVCLDCDPDEFDNYVELEVVEDEAQPQTVGDNSMISENDWWYGIPGIECVERGELEDPEIHYEGMVIGDRVVEDAMWDRYTAECQKLHIARDPHNGFVEYVQKHSGEVKHLIKVSWESYR